MSRKDKKGWDLSVLLSVVGFVFELVRVTVNALRARNGTVDDLRRLLREPELVDEVFDLIVRGTKAVFPVWKTIRLGLRKDAEDARRVLGARCRVSDWANDLLGRITFSSAEKEIDLVVRSVAELGFAKDATLAQIYEAAQKFGLSLCPAEVGPALREHYRNQPPGEWLVIAMEPVTDSGGDLSVFYVERLDDGLWLSSRCGSPGRFWVADFRFVFVSGK